MSCAEQASCSTANRDFYFNYACSHIDHFAFKYLMVLAKFLLRIRKFF